MLLHADGTVKLCDLGMSRFSDVSTTVSSGGLVGSPTYMPPEAFGYMVAAPQPGGTAVAAEPGQKPVARKALDGQVWDVYSCGVLLWWMWHDLN